MDGATEPINNQPPKDATIIRLKERVVWVCFWVNGQIVLPYSTTFLFRHLTTSQQGGKKQTQTETMFSDI